MSVAYQDTAIEVHAGRRFHVGFLALNRSKEPWRASEGYAVGYQVYDPATETLLVDGKRSQFVQDVSPGSTVACSLEVELPPEDGRYRILVSPLQEQVAWFYDLGRPFLLIDAVIENGVVRLERSLEATRRRLGWERFGRSIGRALAFPLTTIWRNRSLIRTMVWRDIAGRYRGTFGGAFWTLLSPLLLMLTYFFVFGIVLEARFAGDSSRTGFALYFLAGMLPWLAFSEAVGRAPTVLLEHRNFIKKLVFPVETLPVNLTAAGLFTEAVAFLLFLGALALTRGAVPMTVVWAPVLLLPQVLLTLGICWFLASFGAFMRDLGQVIGFLLTLWFFLTPICYPETSLPPAIRPMLALNPMYALVRGYRDILLEPRAPDWHAVWKLWVGSGIVFLAGHAFFYKLRRSFADVL